MILQVDNLPSPYQRGCRIHQWGCWQFLFRAADKFSCFFQHRNAPQVVLIYIFLRRGEKNTDTPVEYIPFWALPRCEMSGIHIIGTFLIIKFFTSSTSTPPVTVASSTQWHHLPVAFDFQLAPKTTAGPVVSRHERWICQHAGCFVGGFATSTLAGNGSGIFFFFRSIRGCWKSRVGSWFHCFFWVSNGLKRQVYVVDDDGGDAGGGADIPAGTVYHITWD